MPYTLMLHTRNRLFSYSHGHGFITNARNPKKSENSWDGLFKLKYVFWDKDYSSFDFDHLSHNRRKYWLLRLIILEKRGCIIAYLNDIKKQLIQILRLVREKLFNSVRGKIMRSQILLYLKWKFWHYYYSFRSGGILLPISVPIPGKGFVYSNICLLFVENMRNDNI